MRAREAAEILNVPKRAPGPLRREEVMVALELKAQNKTQAQIAIALGAAPTTISAFFKRYTDTSVAALARLRAGAAHVADDWLKASRNAARVGDHKPARDLLAGIGVIREKPVIGQQVVIVGMGQQAIGPDPWALPADPNAPPTIPAALASPDDVMSGLDETDSE